MLHIPMEVYAFLSPPTDKVDLFLVIKPNKPSPKSTDVFGKGTG